MKGFISPLAAILAVACSSGTSADSPDRVDGKSSSSRDILAELAASVKNTKGTLVGADDWTSQLACTADMASQQPSLIDQATCAATEDSNGQACVWCDATAVLGTGLCASADQKAMLGQFWDQLCAATDDSNTTPVDPPAVTPNPTPPPTPPPTEPAPAPAPDDDGVPDALKCAMDDSSNLITDEATCVAKKDTTSTSDANCVWCVIPIIGGSCITNSMQSSVSFLCSSNEEKGSFLRGANDDNNKIEGGWKELDPSCLGDGLAGGDEQSCGARTDSNGNACIWCDAGDDVFGICAAPSQKDYLNSYMNCADSTVPLPEVGEVTAAVE